MKKLIWILFFYLIGVSLNAFDVEMYDVFKPASEKFASFTAIDNPKHLKWVVSQFNQLIEEKKEKGEKADVKLYRLRNIYLFLYWQLCRDPKEKLATINRGIKYAVETIKAYPEDPEGWLRRGIFIGLLALQQGVLNSLSVAPAMIKYLSKAYDIDKAYLDAEPAIVLGKTLYKLPPFPISYGNKKKAHKLLMEALQLAPDFAYLYVDLAEFELSEGNRKKAFYYLDRIKNLHPKDWYSRIAHHWTMILMPQIRKAFNDPNWSIYNFDLFTLPLNPGNNP